MNFGRLWSIYFMCAAMMAFKRLADNDIYKEKYLFQKYSATLTSPIITGTSTSGLMTATKATPEWMPITATATASSKLFKVAVNESVAERP